jgi:GNAT superfamily N-acetyltransferase
VNEWILERLLPAHHLDSFSCGRPQLDKWLREWAQRSEGTDLGRTYVAHEGDRHVLGYFTLTAHVVDRDSELPPGRGRRNMPRQIPAVLLAKLAVHERCQGQGYGRDLLLAAMERCVALSESAGCRFVIVDALDQRAAEFYERHDFRPIPGASSARLALLIADIRASLAAGARRGD